MNKKVVLIGNPNSGKTTLYNKLTGAYEYTGNRNGVTVSKKVGRIKGGSILLEDLPGIYSLSGYTKEEKIALNCLASERPDGIINVLDGTNLSRGLYLTIRLLKLNLPMMIVINMKDECERENISVDTSGLSAELGVKVLFVSSKTGDGMIELKAEADKIKRADIHSFDRLTNKLSQIEKTMVSDDRSVLRANCIYNYADELSERYVIREGKQKRISEKIDRIILNKYLAYPIMLAVSLFGFFLTFGSPGLHIKKIFESVFYSCVSVPVRFICGFFHGYIEEFVVGGILTGAEAVVSFLPFILLLFFYTSFLEDLGYMSRISYISDKFMKKAGLSGLSLIPLILGFGCSTPAMMSARIIKEERERNRTLFLVAFISCSAKIPVYALLCGIFYQKNYTVVMIFLYALGIVAALIAALMVKGKSRSEGFILELPPYRMPDFKAIFKGVLNKSKEFLLRTGTVIIALSAIVWFLGNFDFRLSKVPANMSILGVAGKTIAPFFAPLGFGFPQAAVSLISGIAAKEGIVSSLGILCGGIENIASFFTHKSALSYLVFVSLYLPCVSSIATLSKEVTQKRWVFFSVVFHMVFAYGAAFIVYIVL